MGVGRLEAGHLVVHLPALVHEIKQLVLVPALVPALVVVALALVVVVPVVVVVVLALNRSPVRCCCTSWGWIVSGDLPLPPPVLPLSLPLPPLLD